jgi:STE24 endopeptidase
MRFSRLLPGSPYLALSGEPPLPASATSLEPAQIDAARQAQAKRYARQRQTLSLVNLLLSAIVIAVLLFTGLSFGLRDALSSLAGWQPIAGWHPLVVAAYLLILLAATTLLGLPLSYYGGFILPHRYGLSTQSLRGWIADDLKGLAISLPIEVGAVELVYLLLALAPDSWWLWTGAAVLVFTVLLANLAPILFVPIFYKLTPLPDGDVRTRALALAERAHTRVRGIYTMNLSSKTTAANAMVMGLGNTRRVIIGDTLLDRYTPDEIEVVVAHELGHQVHHDIPKLVAVEALTTLSGLYLINLVLHLIVAHVALYAGLADAATMPLLGALLGVFGLLVLPLQNGFSRRVERQADVYALETSRNPAAFIGAMTRLANQNLSELDPPPLVEFLLHNHPATGKRIALGHRFAAEHGMSV